MTQTVVLTGITGFIAKRIALDLLEAGYVVRGTLRSRRREAELRAALAARLSDAGLLDNLHLVALDLMDDAGWPEAMAGADALIHTASPFPIAQPRDAEELIRPAVDGTLRALKSASDAGIRRVVLTSSMVAVMYRDTDPGTPITETCWSELSHPTLNAYGQSKTRAEQAAWDFAKARPEMQLVVINPGLVCGRPMDAQHGSSLDVLERILSGRDPMQPDVSLPIVALSDVSRLHLAGLATDAMVGHRHIAADGTRSFPQIARLFAATYPDRGIKTRTAPRVVLRAVALFDPQVRAFLPQLGVRYHIDNSGTTARSGLTFTPADDALLEAADYLVGPNGAAADTGAPG